MKSYNHQQQQMLLEMFLHIRLQQEHYLMVLLFAMYILRLMESTVYKGLHRVGI